MEVVIDGPPAYEELRLNGASWTVTHHPIRVERVVVGDRVELPSVLLLPGGTRPDGLVTSWPDSPSFVEGDRALLLGTVDGGVLRLANFYRSVFRPVEDDAGVTAAATERGVVLQPLACDEARHRRADELLVVDAAEDDHRDQVAGRGLGVPWDTFVDGVASCAADVRP